MTKYNPDSDESIQFLFFEEGEELRKAGFYEPDDCDPASEQVAEFRVCVGRSAVVQDSMEFNQKATSI